MDTSETTTEPERDLDGRTAERQPKRRKELEDVEMTAILAHPPSQRTNEVCGLLVHADIADNKYIEQGLMDENMRDENANAGGLAVISVHNAANLDGWQPELPEKGKAVHGQVRSTSF